MSFSSILRRHYRKLIVICTPILVLPLPASLGSQEGKCAYGLILMAIFWITEALPIPVTALLPIVIFPILGVSKVKTLAHLYFNDINFVFIGGLGVAVAVEKWKIHRRFALRLLLLMGSEPKWLMLGFMLITSFLSMWMSNTATTSMMIPIAQAVLVQLLKTKGLQTSPNKCKEQQIQEMKKMSFDFQSLSDDDKKLCKAFCLSICYAANCGGVATLTGTCTNLVMKGQADLDEKPSFTFVTILDKSAEEIPPLMDWKTLNAKLPWGVCILLGGGFALARACTVGNCAYGLILMAVFWITEALPLPVTALLPIVIFPILGVSKVKILAHLYFNDITFVFIGGLGVAIAVEKWKIHRRFALRLLLLMGSEPKWLMLGFMLITSFLSMWMSNTATTSMMIPIAQAVLVQLLKTKELQTVPDEARATKELIVKVDVHDNREPKLLKEEDKMRQYVKKNKIICFDSVISEARSGEKEDVFDFHSLSDANKKLCKAFCLSICYAANCGGVATLTGTGPNLVMKGQADFLADGESGITFATWFVFGLPVAFVNCLICWFVVQISFFGFRKLLCANKDKDNSSGVQKVIQVEYDKLGQMNFAEKAVIGHFILLVLLWFTLEPEFVPGWGSLFRKGYVKDSVPAIFIVLSLFVFPSRRREKSDKSADEIPPLMDWKTLNAKLPWGVCILLGGGFALARACTDSGLSYWLADQMSVFSTIPPWAMIFVICLIVSFSTEVTSNTAICTIFMPILAELAIGIEAHPVYIMLPAAVATSFAFMLPVATPPNTIAFSYGYLRVVDMAKVGFLINILCVIVVTLAINTYGIPYFGLDSYPEWAKRHSDARLTTVISNYTSDIATAQ
ncbi:hypothetical protein FSP39_002021 [Pinctada imbricata]|uniref:Solute carrier family 13 member 5 n=1 Tax=Pinctada imbricata TaxID=66713 RepID=A0AA89BVA2_PINIB|nr:hypothetical protein FSP39_002021 [Pinctada imbricata]